MEKIFCIHCGSFNTEETVNSKYKCVDCGESFNKSLFRLHYKIANKVLALKTGEMDLGEMITSSMNYIYQSGVILNSKMEEDLWECLGHIPDEVIITKLASLECMIEKLCEE